MIHFNFVRRAVMAFLLAGCLLLLLGVHTSAAPIRQPVPTVLPTLAAPTATAALAATPTALPAATPTPTPLPVPVPLPSDWQGWLLLGVAGGLAGFGTLLLDFVIWFHDTDLDLQHPLDDNQKRILSGVMPGGIVLLSYLALMLFFAYPFDPGTVIPAILEIITAIGGTHLVFTFRPSTIAAGRVAKAQALARARAATEVPHG